jgi:hypothetical protein
MPAPASISGRIRSSPNACATDLPAVPACQQGEGGAAFGGGGGGGGGGEGFEFGVDPNLDPELAMALQVSLEEERARQAAAAAADGGAGEGAAAAGGEAAAAPAAGAAGGVADMDMDEDAVLQRALAMSMAVSGDQGMDSVKYLKCICTTSGCEVQCNVRACACSLFWWVKWQACGGHCMNVQMSVGCLQSWCAVLAISV